VSIVAERRPGPPAGLGVDVVGSLNLVGSFFKPLGAAFLFPAALAVGYGEEVWPFLVAGAATSGFGIALERTTHGKERVGSREGYLVVALLWLLVAVFGALPYVLAVGQLSHPLDAFFESMSGFSASGASVLTDIEGLSRSMAMWRQFTAWIGGLGIIVLFLAVLPRLNVGGRQALFRSEMPGPEIGLEETIRETARRFVLLYVSLTALVVAVLAILGWSGADDRMDLYRAVAHAFTTVSTAGFSTEGRSFEAFAAPTQWAVVVFMLMAGTNFALLYLGIVRRRFGALARDEEFRVYLVLLALVSLLVFAELLSRDVLAGGAALRHAAFNTTSMLTTTGFASADFNTWPPLSLMVLFGVTVLGASAGSTSGSVKLVRHVVIAKMLRREVQQAVHPELITPLRVNGNVIDEKTLRAIIFFVLLYLGVLAGSAVVIMLDSSLRGLDVTPFDALADSATALGGVGPGLGFAGPMGSYEPFSGVSKLVLAMEMYLGRLEIVPILVLLAGSYWRR
jgi:trk system potassium uptake protein TrkH